MPTNTQPGTVTSQNDRDIWTQREGLAIPTNTKPGTLTSRRDIKEQVETRYSWDSLATPPTAQPVTANWVDRQPQEHRPKTHTSTTMQSIQLTNPRTPNSHHFLLKGPSFNRNIAHEELANNPLITELPACSNRTADESKLPLHSNQNAVPGNKPAIIFTKGLHYS